jgi:hypothetical protein
VYGRLQVLQCLWCLGKTTVCMATALWHSGIYKLLRCIADYSKILLCGTPLEDGTDLRFWNSYFCHQRTPQHCLMIKAVTDSKILTTNSIFSWQNDHEQSYTGHKSNTQSVWEHVLNESPLYWDSRFILMVGGEQKYVNYMHNLLHAQHFYS